MKAKDFNEANVKLAEGQEEYQTLPAFFNPDDGSMTFCFELDEAELNRIKATGEIWFQVMTFGRPMQPIAMTTNKEQLIPPKWYIKEGK